MGKFVQPVRYYRNDDTGIAFKCCNECPGIQRDRVYCDVCMSCRTVKLMNDEAEALKLEALKGVEWA